MKIQLILKKCDYYIELFKNETNVDSHNINDFLDFANLHLPSNSNMAFAIHSLNKKNFSNHAEKIKEFIKVNGSANTEKNINIFSSNSNAEIIAKVFGICTIFFSVGFYFGTEKVNNDYLINKTELTKIKDSLTRVSTNSRTNSKK